MLCCSFISLSSMYELGTSVTVSCAIIMQCFVYSMFHHEENGGRPVQSLSTNQNDSLHEVVPNCQANQYYAGKQHVTCTKYEALLQW